MSKRSEEYRELRKKLTQLREQVTQSEAQLQRILPKLIAENVQEALESEILSQIEQPIGLNRIAYRNFLCSDKSAADINLESTPIALHGSGPWECEEFQTFLDEKGFDLVSIDEAADLFILGGSVVDENVIHEFISNAISDNSSPKIYTQEMLVYFLISGEDPIEVWTKETLLDAVVEHRGMEIVLTFPDLSWPNETTLSDEDFTISEIDTGEWSNESPLKKLGYTVKDGALSDRQRRDILIDSYKKSLDPFLTSEHERKRWGRPSSTQRLYAIASFIHWLSEFQGNGKPLAYEKWRSDLDWLKTQFFDRRMQFKWPTNNTPKNRASKITDFSNTPQSLHSLHFSQLHLGSSVYHKHFGRGIVLKISFSLMQAEIEFSSPYGVRMLDLKSTQLFKPT
jgi:hypothetical protein